MRSSACSPAWPPKPYGSVFYADFPGLGLGGGGVCGPSAGVRFLQRWRYESTMRFGGAFKIIRRLQEENRRLRAQLRDASPTE